MWVAKVQRNGQKGGAVGAVGGGYYAIARFVWFCTGFVGPKPPYGAVGAGMVESRIHNTWHGPRRGGCYGPGTRHRPTRRVVLFGASLYHGGSRQDAQGTPAHGAGVGQVWRPFVRAIRQAPQDSSNRSRRLWQGPQSM